MRPAVLKNDQRRRYLSLWFPDLPFERMACAAPADVPTVQVEKQKGVMRLAACNHAARYAGLRLQMTLAEARAIVPVLQADPMDRLADQECLLQLTSFCERFTPLFAMDGADGIMLDVTGCAHLYGGEQAMAAHVVRLITAKGFTPKHAMAGTPDCAHVLARFSEITHVPEGGEREAVSRLPVAALKTGADTMTALMRAGLKTLGDVAARQSQIFRSRFGQEVTRKLARILGEENVRITPLRPEPALSEQQMFMEPLHQVEYLLHSMSGLIERLCERLESAGEGGRCFEAIFFRSDGNVRRLQIETARALRSPHDIVKLFSLRLETLHDPLDPGFGFDGLRLSVLQSDALRENQKNLQDIHHDTIDEGTVINRLRIRYGRESVLQFKQRDSHDPLREAALTPVADTRAHWQNHEEGLPRPLNLFSPAQRIDVISEVPDGPPMRFRWRRALHRVVTAEGPERITTEWWREPERQTRDYYRVEDDAGGRFWIYREGLFTNIEPPPKWFLHGVFA
jgi:protein ImuB